MTVYTCPTQGRLQPCIFHVIKEGPAAAGGKSGVGEGRSASCGGRKASDSGSGAGGDSPCSTQERWNRDGDGDDAGAYPSGEGGDGDGEGRSGAGVSTPGSRQGAGGGDVNVGSGAEYFKLLNNKKDHHESFRPSAATLASERYPSFDKTRLGRFRSTDDAMGQLAFTFFTFTFPAVVVAFIVKQ
ncbi:unnamed protein product, partial [Pylaiella littoralis]